MKKDVIKKITLIIPVKESSKNGKYTTTRQREMACSGV